LNDSSFEKLNGEDSSLAAEIIVSLEQVNAVADGYR
jgi:hypothetical protein